MRFVHNVYKCCLHIWQKKKFMRFINNDKLFFGEECHRVQKKIGINQENALIHLNPQSNYLIAKNHKLFTYEFFLSIFDVQ